METIKTEKLSAKMSERSGNLILTTMPHGDPRQATINYIVKGSMEQLKQLEAELKKHPFAKLEITFKRVVLETEYAAVEQLETTPGKIKILEPEGR